MYYWVLVLTIVLNGETRTVEIEPLDWLMCKISVNNVEKKQIFVDGVLATVSNAKCERRFKKQ